jgi:hypothetical protein
VALSAHDATLTGKNAGHHDRGRNYVLVERRPLVRGPSITNWRYQGGLYRLNRAMARGGVTPISVAGMKTVGDR